MTIRTILVATDFSDQAAVAVAAAAEWATLHSARLVLLHVQEDIAARYGRHVPAMAMSDVQNDIEGAARSRLEAVRRSLPVKDVDAVLVRSLNTAECIIDYAKTHEIDLVVLGTHGREGMAHFFMGSVAERVMRLSPCSVLIVKPARPIREPFETKPGA